MDYLVVILKIYKNKITQINIKPKNKNILRSSLLQFNIAKLGSSAVLSRGMQTFQQMILVDRAVYGRP